jgi:DNA ligase-1
VRNFTQLIHELDSTNKTSEKVQALVRHFETASPGDAAWAAFFLAGRRARRLVKTGDLRELACQQSGIPNWMFEECYETVGDLAETISHLLPPPELDLDMHLEDLVRDHILQLRDKSDDQKRRSIVNIWRGLTSRERFVYIKLITGGFRLGVSQRLLTRALAEVSGLQSSTVAHRLMGDWEPSAEFFEQLFSSDQSDVNESRPYPFFLPHPIGEGIAALGGCRDWIAEWKWDGIRCQLVRRSERVYLWSRGEELVTNRFPEIAEAALQLPDGTVLDGELLAFKDGCPLPFSRLQRRIGRKNVGKKTLREIPVIMMAFDLLEQGGVDIRAQPLLERRRRLDSLVSGLGTVSVRVSPTLDFSSWDELGKFRASSREFQAEGIMLKRRDSHYQVGRPRGHWWKWKIDPYTADAVLIYAQRGHGRRAGLYTDYTFGLWSGSELVPFAKAYSGLVFQSPVDPV